jgi:hypothetical protein
LLGSESENESESESEIENESESGMSNYFSHSQPIHGKFVYNGTPIDLNCN